MKPFFGILKSLSYAALLGLALSGCATTSGGNQAQVERLSPEELEKLMPPPVAALSLEEVIADSKAGKSAAEIIEKIKVSNSRYPLTPSKALELSQQGVKPEVLDYMHQSNELAKQNAIADEMQKRDQSKANKIAELQRQRNNMGIYDPYWGLAYPGWGMGFGRPWIGPIGPAGRMWRGNRFGMGLGFGYPYGWAW